MTAVSLIFILQVWICKWKIIVLRKTCLKFLFPLFLESIVGIQGFCKVKKLKIINFLVRYPLILDFQEFHLQTYKKWGMATVRVE